MEVIIEKPKRLTGLALCKKMLSEKKETQRQMREDFKTNPEIQKIIEELKKRNEERGTPIISL
jgi:hypothetical protein